MATVSITIPDAKLPRVVNAFARKFVYQDIIAGSPNPESKAAFAQRMMRQMIRDVVAEMESLDARDVANSDATLVT